MSPREITKQIYIEISSYKFFRYKNLETPEKVTLKLVLPRKSDKNRKYPSLGKRSKNSTPYTIRYLIRYVSFNILFSHPAMHIEGFNIHRVRVRVHNIATMCASMHITPINMSGDPCAIHIVHSVCCPIVGAIHIEYDNMTVFKSFNTYCHWMYCSGQYVLNCIL